MAMQIIPDEDCIDRMTAYALGKIGTPEAMVAASSYRDIWDRIDNEF